MNNRQKAIKDIESCDRALTRNDVSGRYKAIKMIERTVASAKLARERRKARERQEKKK